MAYRTQRTLGEQMAGTAARGLRGLISARQLLTDSYEAVERVFVRGRASLDPAAEDDGEFDGLEAENCQPIGMVARPAVEAEVVAVVANVGADGTNPYLIGTIDSTRDIVIDARGIAADVLIIYNTTDVVEIRDGKIRAGSLSGTTQPLVTKSDFDAHVQWVKSQFDGPLGHVHVVAGPATTTMVTVPSTPTAAPTPSVPPTPTYTVRFEAE